MGSSASKRHLEEVQLKWAESTVQGRRQYNEDRSSISHPHPPLKKPYDFGQSLFSVFDGHGGEWAAEYAAGHLHDCIAKQAGYHANSSSKEAALVKGYLYCDECLIGEQEGCGDKSGSTGCTVLVDHTDIYTANCGDTRAILCRAGRALDLSHEHKPTDAPEKARMEAAGARVPPGSAYVELGDKALAVARAFGNPLWKQNPAKKAGEQIIIPHPHTTRTPRRLGQDEFLLLATDGLTNVLPSQAAVDFVRKRLLQSMDVEDIAHRLTQHALDRKSQDNVSVVIVVFPPAFSGSLLEQVQVEPIDNAASSSADAK